MTGDKNFFMKFSKYRPTTTTMNKFIAFQIYMLYIVQYDFEIVMYL